MSLRNTKLTIDRLRNKINYLENLKDKEFHKTQPQSISADKEMVNGGVPSDKFLTYAMKTEQLDEKLNKLYLELKVHENYYKEEIKLMKKYNEVEKLVITLRELENLKWHEISKITFYSDRQCQRIYKRYQEEQR